jgi:hypothetical protein
MRRIIVFSGPTLPHRDITAMLPGAICLPPAVQGSILAATLQFAPAAILLIDGGFQSEPAVRHNEILWAISRGVHVLGAASMGALRAAELHPHMTGYGLIYRWYRRCMLAPDDAVAVLHGPAELGYLPLTEAGIDLRMTIAHARRRGVLSHESAKRLGDAVRRLNFRNRLLETCVDDAGLCTSAKERGELIASLRSLRVPQKQADAMTAIKNLASGHALSPKRAISFEPTQAFISEVRAAGFDAQKVLSFLPLG